MCSCKENIKIKKLNIRWKWFHDMQQIRDPLSTIIFRNWTLAASQVYKRKLAIGIFTGDQIGIIYMCRNDPVIAILKPCKMANLKQWKCWK